MQRVLFICVHNSARSQMAEEYLRDFVGDGFEVESAGLTPTAINPLVIEAMAEDGHDLSRKKTQSVFELFRQGRLFHYVVTVCDESAEGQCPIFPGLTHRLHLPFPDPAGFTGTHDEKLARVREVRDAIKEKVRSFADWLKSGEQAPLAGGWKSL